MTKKIFASAFAVFSIVTAVALTSSAQASECSEFPQASWWGAMSHAKVISYVEMRHAGNWDAYLKKWDQRLETAANALDRGAALKFKSSGQELKGDSLGFYVQQVEQRQAVSRCLAAQADGYKNQLTAIVVNQ